MNYINKPYNYLEKIIMNKRSLFFIALLIINMSALGKSLQQIKILHPVLGERLVTYEAVSGSAVTEGDIILKPIESKIKMQASIVNLSVRRWDNGIIPYEIDEALPDANRTAVIQAMQLWEKVTPVRFVLRTEDNYAQYPDYVSFIAEGGRMCASYVGRYGGKQIVQLSSRCNTMITAHEIGHVLGLWHEQSRLDRDNYVRIVWDNIEERSKYNFAQHLTDGLDHGPYNYQSIMHYSANAFSKNGEPTIIPLKEGITIGQRDEISALDILAVNAMYLPKQNQGLNDAK